MLTLPVAQGELRVVDFFYRNLSRTSVYDSSVVGHDALPQSVDHKISDNITQRCRPQQASRLVRRPSLVGARAADGEAVAQAADRLEVKYDPIADGSRTADSDESRRLSFSCRQNDVAMVRLTLNDVSNARPAFTLVTAAGNRNTAVAKHFQYGFARGYGDRATRPVQYHFEVGIGLVVSRFCLEVLKVDVVIRPVIRSRCHCSHKARWTTTVDVLALDPFLKQLVDIQAL